MRISFYNINFEELVPALIDHPELIYHLDPSDLFQLLEDPDAVDIREGEQISCYPYTAEDGKDGIYLQVEYPYEFEDGVVSYLPVDFDPKMVILF